MKLEKLKKVVMIMGTLALACGCQNIFQNSEIEPKFVAHRGESSKAPENTMAAFREAWQQGNSYAIEVDVYSNKDSELVCIHDGNLKRVTGGASEEHVENMHMYEIKKYDVGSFKGKEFANERIPALAEVFAELPKAGKIFLELKKTDDNFNKKLIELLERYNVDQEQIVIISFSEEELKKVNQIFPFMKNNLLVWIGTNEKTGEAGVSTKDYVSKLQDLGCTGIDAGGLEKVDAEYVKTIKDAGLEFHAWTIDDPVEAERLFSIGIDTVTTNSPSYLMSELK